ncbi:hypothetical protein TNCV_3461321 [Trichonephila clavipes]|nr:hypothetical protein TNCV_3461321 [Trichonephila clavipes]
MNELTIVVAHATCLTKSDRGPRDSSWQWARCTPVVGLSLEHHTGDSMISLDEIPEGTIEHYDRWRHQLFPPPQFKHGTEEERNFLRFPALAIQPTRFSDPLV